MHVIFVFNYVYTSQDAHSSWQVHYPSTSHEALQLANHPSSWHGSSLPLQAWLVTIGHHVDFHTKFLLSSSGSNTRYHIVFTPFLIFNVIYYQKLHNAITFC